MAIPSGIASTRTLTDIANAIRFKNGENWRYTPGQMADKVAALNADSEGGGMQYPYDNDVLAGKMTVLPYTAIANAIRGQNGETRDYKPSEMADAIRALSWDAPKAYAVAIPSDTDTSKFELHFIRSDIEPMMGMIYHGKTIYYVYSGFEDKAYTSNSQVPWYPQHDDFTHVFFDDVIKPKSCIYWFYMMRYCVSFELANLDLSIAESLAYTFYYCSAATTISLFGKSSPLVSNMKYCFYQCAKLVSLDVRYLDVASVTDFTECFRGCTLLADLKGLDTWYVSSMCTNTQHMFNGCTKLPTLKLGTWDMSNVANASYMFQRLSIVTEIDMSGLTWGSNTTNITSMFNGDGKLVTIYAKAGTALTGATSSTSVFYNCYNLKGGAGSSLNTSTSLKNEYVGGVYARIDGLGGQAGYFTAK